MQRLILLAVLAGTVAHGQAQSFDIIIDNGTVIDGSGLPRFRADVLAGLVVGVVALPLSMALAIAVGAPPQHGLYTAIVAGIVTALLGVPLRNFTIVAILGALTWAAGPFTAWLEARTVGRDVDLGYGDGMSEDDDWYDDDDPDYYREPAPGTQL